ncbi:hypothetical protein Poli38472_005732 [Pythium oligandrum]|uniref:Transmembrane protein 65 n=1 Tax=Pythium oligandrum TaxID=41045 RepID=A0A8K1FPD4_PYTOL|nr:hypothetical protein Poli38472_005732 [Pythium oligandrum]|eukprot:TMW68264.1 hypothetical protein Poli38472_005732 [Pythium oligandrum]
MAFLARSWCVMSPKVVHRSLLASTVRSQGIRFVHSRGGASSETLSVLHDLQAALKDPHAAEKLGGMLSSSTTKNLTRALASVKHEQHIAGATAAAAAQAPEAPKATISMQELKYVALQVGLPFIGFGFVDNAIMIIAGDYIDMTVGVSLGISSMAAAGIGNTISDIAGLGLGGVVEDFCARLGLPTPALTPQQMMLKETRIAKVVGSSIGVTIGCLLGMLPLLFLETRDDKKQEETKVGLA